MLHVFQKKSKHGIGTPKRKIDLVKSRYEVAREHDARLRAQDRENAMAKRTREGPERPERDDEVLVEESSGNVFADLGFPDADELLAKAELARTIRGLIERRNLTQTDAARLLGTTQPKVSDLFRGRLEGFSMERLYRFLNTLGQDVQIVVRPKPPSRDRATIRAEVKPAVA